MTSNLKIKSSAFMHKLLLMQVMVIFAGSTGFSQPSASEIKAVALDKLSLFIEWPRNNAERDNSNFVITVISDLQFSEVLEEVYRNHKIKDKPVKVVCITDLSKLPDCQMVFIPKVKQSVQLKILDIVKNRPVLTVSENEGFAKAGGFINFYYLDGKLRFEINQKAMKSAGFNIDYKLLRVARVVDSASG